MATPRTVSVRAMFLAFGSGLVAGALIGLLAWRHAISPLDAVCIALVAAAGPVLVRFRLGVADGGAVLGPRQFAIVAGITLAFEAIGILLVIGLAVRFSGGTPTNPDVIADLNAIEVPIFRVVLPTYSSNPSQFTVAGSHAYFTADVAKPTATSAQRRLVRYEIGKGAAGIHVYDDFTPGELHTSVDKGVVWHGTLQGATGCFLADGTAGNVTQLLQATGDILAIGASHDGAAVLMLRRAAQQVELLRIDPQSATAPPQVLYAATFSGLTAASHLVTLDDQLTAFLVESTTGGQSQQRPVLVKGGQDVLQQANTAVPKTWFHAVGDRLLIGLGTASAGIAPQASMTHTVIEVSASNTVGSKLFDTAKAMLPFVHSGRLYYCDVQTGALQLQYIEAGAVTTLTGSSAPAAADSWAVLDGKLYLLGTDANGDATIWSVDTTYTPVSFAKTWTPCELSAIDGQLSFGARYGGATASSSTWHVILWRPDSTGTPPKRIPIAGLAPGAAPSAFVPAEAGAARDLLFRAQHDVYGVEPWRLPW